MALVQHLLALTIGHAWKYWLDMARQEQKQKQEQELNWRRNRQDIWHEIYCPIAVCALHTICIQSDELCCRLRLLIVFMQTIVLWARDERVTNDMLGYFAVPVLWLAVSVSYIPNLV